MIVVQLTAVPRTSRRRRCVININFNIHDMSLEQCAPVLVAASPTAAATQLAVNAGIILDTRDHRL